MKPYEQQDAVSACKSLNKQALVLTLSGSPDNAPLPGGTWPLQQQSLPVKAKLESKGESTGRSRVCIKRIPINRNVLSSNLLIHR